MESKDIFMLCESCQDETELANFNRERYKAQIKFDGERVMAVKSGSEIMLFNRRGNILNYKFQEVVKALSKLNHDFMIDGEIINIDDTICGNFNLLSRRALTKDLTKIKALEKEIPIKFMVFDILSFEKSNIKGLPLKERLTFLSQLLKENTDEHLELVNYDSIDNCLMRVIEGTGEGIVIKNMDGTYESKRSKNWIKHKLFKETTINITGFTENPKGIRATDNEGNVVQISGTQSNEVKDLLVNTGYATILVQYLSKGKEGRMRMPSYRGLAN